jgi:hypothetical protein
LIHLLLFGNWSRGWLVLWFASLRQELTRLPGQIIGCQGVTKELSAVRDGEGAVTQPPSKPKATNGIEYFIFAVAIFAFALIGSSGGHDRRNLKCFGFLKNQRPSLTSAGT